MTPKARASHSQLQRMLVHIAEVCARCKPIAATNPHTHWPGNASVQCRAGRRCQNRASPSARRSGAFCRGCCLTARKPELEYRTAALSHTIVALKGMVALASRARELAQDIGFGGAIDAHRCPPWQTRIRSGARRRPGGGQAISFAPQFNMPPPALRLGDSCAECARRAAEHDGCRGAFAGRKRSVLHDSLKDDDDGPYPIHADTAAYKSDQAGLKPIAGPENRTALAAKPESSSMSPRGRIQITLQRKITAQLESGNSPNLTLCGAQAGTGRPMLY